MREQRRGNRLFGRALVVTVAAGLLLLSAAPPASGEEEDPAAELKQRTNCAVQAAPQLLAAGTSFGIVFYPLPASAPAEATLLEPFAQALMLPDSVNDLLVHDGRLLAANGPQGLVEVSGVGESGAQCRVAATVPTPGAAMALAAEGARLFVAMGVMGVGIYDVKSGSGPTAVARLDLPGYVRHLLVRPEGKGRHRLFVAAEDEGIVSVLLDRSGKEVGTSRRAGLPGPTRRLFWHEQQLFAMGRMGLCRLPAAWPEQEQATCGQSSGAVRDLLADPATGLLWAATGEQRVVAFSPGDGSPAGPELPLERGVATRLYLLPQGLLVGADHGGLILLPRPDRQ